MCAKSNCFAFLSRAVENQSVAGFDRVLGDRKSVRGQRRDGHIIGKDQRVPQERFPTFRAQMFGVGGEKELPQDDTILEFAGQVDIIGKIKMNILE